MLEFMDLLVTRFWFRKSVYLLLLVKLSLRYDKVGSMECFCILFKVVLESENCGLSTNMSFYMLLVSY